MFAAAAGIWVSTIVVTLLAYAVTDNWTVAFLVEVMGALLGAVVLIVLMHRQVRLNETGDKSR